MVTQCAAVNDDREMSGDNGMQGVTWPAGFSKRIHNVIVKMPTTKQLLQIAERRKLLKGRQVFEEDIFHGTQAD